MIRKHSWLITLFMLIFAAIACDENLPNIPHVTDVWADPHTAGKAYAYLFKGYGEEATPLCVYLTTDYGQTWALTNDAPPITAVLDNTYQLIISNRILYEYQNEHRSPIWEFPRRTYMEFFHGDAEKKGFILPPTAVSNSVAFNVVYIAMGTEGVLVGHFPSDKLNDWSAVRWELRQQGFAELNPVPLTFTNVGSIIGVIIAGLMIPPLIFLHQRLLRNVWAYLTDTRRAGLYALVTTLIITVAAILALVIWLTDVRTDYYGIVAVMTAFTLVVSLGTAAWLARKVGLTHRWPILLGATALVALIVPAGVAAIWWLWPPIITLSVGFAVYRRYYERHFMPQANTDLFMMRWLIDKSALITLFAYIFLGLLTTAIVWFVMYNWLHIYELGIVGLTILIVFASLMAKIVLPRIQAYFQRQTDAHPELPALSINQTHYWLTAAWLLVSILISGGLFYAQAMVYDWFQTLPH